MRALFALLLAALVLAGCADPDAAPDEGASTPASDAGAPHDDGSSTTRVVDTGHMPHIHDYWKGKERVTLFDGEVDPSAIDPFQSAFVVVVQKEAHAGGVLFFLPENAIVYEGTGQMDITATWDDPVVTSLGVALRPPDSQEFMPRQALASGEALSLDVPPEWTDMPHAKTSRWQLYFSPAEDAGAAMAPFRLKIEIVKLRDVMLFPAHPELFEGKPEKVLHEEKHSFSEVSYAKRVPNLLASGEFPEKEVTPTHLVPMETLWMRVEVEILSASALPGKVADIRFFYHGANRSVLAHPFLLPAEGSLESKRLVYELPVAMEETDTPYGKESQWRFFVEPTTKFTDREEEPDCGGCTDVSIEYTMRIVAYDHARPGPASKPSG